MGYYVEIEYASEDDEDSRNIVGPFRTRESAQKFADRLGRAAGLEQAPQGGYWFCFGGIYSAYVMVLSFEQARVRALARRIKDHINGDMP